MRDGTLARFGSFALWSCLAACSGSSADTSDDAATGAGNGATSSATSSTGTGATSQGSVVFGLTSQLVRPYFDVDRLHVTLRRDGVVVSDETLTADAESDDSLMLPRELAIEGDEGAMVEATLEAFATGSEEPLVTREAGTRVVGGKTLLHTVELESCCAAGRSSAEIHDHADAVPSSAITCDAGETCVAGACAEAFVEPETLAEHVTTWADGVDACRPPGQHTPMLEIGQGLFDYTPAASGDLAQLGTGGQDPNAYHVWIALHADHIHQKGTITKLTARVPELDYDVPPFAVIFPLEPSDIRGCELYALRFQLTWPGTPTVVDIAGKTIEVQAELTASDGTKVSASRTFVLSDTTECVDGTVVPAGDCYPQSG
jgi:hypothetical protein